VKRLALGFLALIASVAWAEPIISFGYLGMPAGVLSTSGLGGAVKGTAIPVQSMTARDVPLNGGTHAVTGAYFEFETAPITSFEEISPGIYSYTYAAGGYFRMHGNVPDAGLTGPEPALLLEGTFYDGTFTATQFAPGTTQPGYMIAFNMGGSDTKSADLLRYFGIPESQVFSFSGISLATNFLGTLGTTGSFSANAFNSDIANTAAPEPSAMLTLGTGLLIVTGLLRRRWTARKDRLDG
jgi:hypothetical protein